MLDLVKSLPEDPDELRQFTALLLPDAIGRYVLAGQAIFADDTPVNMLAPGTGKTKTARLWAYGRDERPWGNDAPPTTWYQFSPDRKGQHPKGSPVRISGLDACGWICRV